MSTSRRPSVTRAIVIAAASAALLACAPRAAETTQAATLQVVCSGGFSAALRELAPEFERSSGIHLAIARGPSMGHTQNAIPLRLQRGERIDVVIMVGSALDGLARDGKVVASSRVDLARSVIGVVVRKGAPRPDISSADAVKRALLDAASIAYSDSASGVYISTEMLPQLGIADQVKAKARMIPAEPVAQVVARGEAEIGFQQMSELLPVSGVDLIGPLPPELQKITPFAAGIVVGASAPDAARALIRFLSSPAAVAAIVRSGLMPIASAPPAAPAEPRQVLAPSGTLRIGVYADSPISLLRGGDGREPRGVAHDIGEEVARRLGVPAEVVEFPRVAEVLAALKAGRVDLTVTNATPARAEDVDFTAPILLLELGYLVPPGSAIASLADADRTGVRIGVMQGSTSQTTLPRQLKAATVVPAPSMKAAGEMLARHELDAFATNKANLFELADGIPGARVLDDRWGTEHLAIAIPRGRDRARAWLDRFIAEAQRDGVVARAVARAGLRGTTSADSRP